VQEPDLRLSHRGSERVSELGSRLRAGVVRQHTRGGFSHDIVLVAKDRGYRVHGFLAANPLQLCEEPESGGAWGLRIQLGTHEPARLGTEFLIPRSAELETDILPPLLRGVVLFEFGEQLRKRVCESFSLEVRRLRRSERGEQNETAGEDEVFHGWF